MNIQNTSFRVFALSRFRECILIGLLGIAIMSSAWTSTKFTGQGFTVVASTIQGSAVTDNTYKITADNNVYFKMINQVAGTFMEAESQKMTVITNPAGGSNNSIKSAELCGPVKLVYTTSDPKTNGRSTMTATADSATYDGIKQIAYLVGNVKIINDNPALFQEPAVMTGDKATINIKPGSAPEFKVESAPGVSRIEVTPKKEATETK